MIRHRLAEYLGHRDWYGNPTSIRFTVLCRNKGMTFGQPSLMRSRFADTRIYADFGLENSMTIAAEASNPLAAARLAHV